MKHRIINEALDRALEEHPRFAAATIRRVCDDCHEGTINYQEMVWHPELGQYVIETVPSDCFICSGTGYVMVTSSAAELLDRACKNVGLS